MTEEETKGAPGVFLWGRGKGDGDTEVPVLAWSSPSFVSRVRGD